MGTSVQAPFMRMTNADPGAALMLELPSLFAGQVRWLLVDRGTRVSAEELVCACPNLRRLHVLDAVQAYPPIPVSCSRALAGVQSFSLDCVGDGPADGLADIDRVLGYMPALRDLSLGYIARYDVGVIPSYSPWSPTHMHHIALENYKVSAVFLHAGLPLFASQDTLMTLHLSLSAHDSAAARQSLLEVLARVSLRRLRQLTLVNRDAHLREAVVTHILAAFPTVRHLRLVTCDIFLNTYDLLAVILFASGPCLSTLSITTQMLPAQLARAVDFGTLLRCVPCLRRLELRVAARPSGAAGERLRDACRARRVSFVIAPR